MNDKDTPDINIDPEEIMKNVLERVNTRRSLKISYGSGDLDDDINFINAHSDIFNPHYLITSHRPFGKMLVKGRQLVNNEVKRYVDPIIKNQSDWNAAVARVIQSEIYRLAREVKNIRENIRENQERPGFSKWEEMYSKELTEDDLKANIDYHEHFITLIKKYAQISAENRIPRVIEVGTGTGLMSIFFSCYSNFKVFGIDNNINVLSWNLKNNITLGGYAKFILMNIFDLDIIKEKYFDVAFSQGTMEHFDNESIIELLSNQLKIANYVIFSVPSRNWPTKEYGNERKLNLDDWRNLLDTAGFTILYLNYYHDDMHIAAVICT